MNRRSALWLGGGLVACLAGCATAGYGGPARTLRIAAGEAGGLYLEFAQLLADQLGKAEPLLTGRAVRTSGSVDNLNRLDEGRVELALTLLDVATSAVGGAAPFPTPRPITAIGRVYENYLQLVVPADSPIRTVEDLVGRRVSLGAKGSGASVFGDRLVAASRIRADVRHLPLAEAVAALAAGHLDALLWSGGVPTPALSTLDKRRPIRLVSMGAYLPALTAAYGPVYERVVVPDGGYGDPAELTTIGVPNLLVCDRDLTGDVVDAITRMLVNRASQLVPPQALGTQYLAERSLIATGRVPLHPAAAAAYRDLRG